MAGVAELDEDDAVRELGTEAWANLDIEVASP
jgi:hypothetical protein